MSNENDKPESMVSKVRRQNAERLAKEQEEAKLAMAHLNETEKIIFDGELPPAKYYGTSSEGRELTAADIKAGKVDGQPYGEEIVYDSPDNGTVKGKVYTKNELDPAFEVSDEVNPIVEDLNKKFQDELAVIEEHAKHIGLTNIQTGQSKEDIIREREAQQLRVKVDGILDKYLDSDLVSAGKLFCEAVNYERRFLIPILEEDMRFFRELENMGFIKIALAVKALDR